MVNEFFVWEKPNSISCGNNFLPGFPNLVAKLLMIKPLHLETKRLMPNKNKLFFDQGNIYHRLKNTIT
jgi:hypothetical protein